MGNVRVRVSSVIAALGLAVSAGAGTALAAPSNSTSFVAVAHLSGSNEVPPVVDTRARGVASYRMAPDGTALEYTLLVANLTSAPQAAHIHAPAEPGRNAPVVAVLFQPDAHSSCHHDTALRLHCSGRITAADLVGPLTGRPLSALRALMADGQSYTNVHTARHPSGELRGQNQPRIRIPPGFLNP
jgi:CHRD domain